MRIANFVFLALFLFSAAVQYNDPDPIQWMAIYFSAAASCVAWELDRLPRAVAIALLVISFAWAGWVFEGLHVTAPMGEAMTDWKMHSGGSEELRESLGLVIVGLWMTALATQARNKKAGGPAIADPPAV